MEDLNHQASASSVWPAPDQQQGLNDYWQAYETHYLELQAKTLSWA